MPYRNSIGEPAGYEDEMGMGMGPLQFEDMPYSDTMNPVADAQEPPMLSPLMGGFPGAPGGMPALPDGPPGAPPMGPPMGMMPPMGMGQPDVSVQQFDKSNIHEMMRDMLMQRASEREAAAKRVSQKFSKLGPGTPGGY
tara:strand:- start:228 stop:644 length:417 start_codon:yes stop_codon:yes gene_type:complete